MEEGLQKIDRLICERPLLKVGDVEPGIKFENDSLMGNLIFFDKKVT